MTPKKLDLHHYSQKHEAALTHLEESSANKNNATLIKRFDQDLVHENLSIPRRLKILSALAYFSKHYLNKDFDKASIEDLKKAITTIENNDRYSVWTKHSYKVILKKFYKWNEYGSDYKEHDDYPAKVKWIRCNVKTKDQPRVKASDLLTEEEVQHLIEAAETPRDKALLSLLYELGARIGELGSLKIGDITQDQYGFIIDLSGKTGHRTPRIILSNSHLLHWLNVHPDRNNKNAPLWTSRDRKTQNIKALDYTALRLIVLRVAHRSGLVKVDEQKLRYTNSIIITGGKRIHPHLFRHSRCTHVLLNNELTETEAKIYFGWVPDTKMIANYAHLRIADVNNKILKNNGLLPDKPENQNPKFKTCPRCNFTNSTDYKFCGKCSSILDLKAAVELENTFNENILNNDAVLDSVAKDFIQKKAPEIIERLIAEKPELLMKMLAKKTKLSQ